MAARVAILMGSESDRPVMQQAAEVLESLGIEHEMHVMSAHRTPQKVASFARSAARRGLKVIIAGAGKAAHLAGAIAANTALPVIGVPLSSKDLGGLDALLSTVQMPTGVPVATVAIDGAKNAALLAAQMLALEDRAVTRALASYRKTVSQKRRRA
jgi:phosphoribosylaminoimidazole carboxylase PurE protein